MLSLRCPRGLMAGWGRDQVVGTMSSPSPHAGPDPDRFAPSSPGERRTLPLWQSSAHRLRGEGWSVTVTGARDAGHCSECGMLIPFCFVSERTAPVASVLWRGRRQHRAGKSLAPGHAAKAGFQAQSPPCTPPALPLGFQQGLPHSLLASIFLFPSPAWPVGSRTRSGPFSLQSHPPELSVPRACDVSPPNTF